MRTPEAVVARSSSSSGTGGLVGLAKGTKLVVILALMLVLMRRVRGDVTSNGSREARGVAEPDPGVGGLSRAGFSDCLPHGSTDDSAVATELGHQIIDRDVVGCWEFPR